MNAYSFVLRLDWDAWQVAGIIVAALLVGRVLRDVWREHRHRCADGRFDRCRCGRVWPCPSTRWGRPDRKDGLP